MKSSNNTIGNRTRDLPACSAVPQPTAPPRPPPPIPLSLAKVHETLASLGGCHQSGECAKSCLRGSVYFCNQSGGMSVLVCYSHVT